MSSTIARESSRPGWILKAGRILGILGVFLLYVSMMGRADSPEETAVASSHAVYIAMVFAASAFSLAYWFAFRWRILRRLPFALVVAAVMGAIAWQICLYPMLYRERIAHEALERAKAEAGQKR